MGWYQDAVDSVEDAVKRVIKDSIDWIIEQIGNAMAAVWRNIVKPALSFIGENATAAIKAMTQRVREFRKSFIGVQVDFQEWIAKQMETPWKVGAAVALTTVAIIAVAALGATELGQAIAAKFQEAVATIKSGLNTLYIPELLQAMQSINQVLATVWPEWRALMEEWGKVVAGLSETLGFTASFLSNLTEAGQAVMGAALIIPGFKYEAARLRAFDKTNAFLQRVRKKAEYYALDPGRVINDFVSEVESGELDTLFQFSATLRSNVAEAHRAIKSVFGSVTRVKRSFDEWVADFPDSVSKSINNWWGPISEKFDKNVVKPLNKYIEVTDKIQNEIEEWGQVNAQDTISTTDRFKNIESEFDWMFTRNEQGQITGSRTIGYWATRMLDDDNEQLSELLSDVPDSWRGEPSEVDIEETAGLTDEPLPPTGEELTFPVISSDSWMIAATGESKPLNDFLEE